MVFDLVTPLRILVARMFRDQTGASATMVAIALPALVGFGALGAETGLWFNVKLQNQSAADAAAISAGYQVLAGKTNLGDLTTAASEAAARNGYKGGTPTVIYPYSDDTVIDGVAVSLQQTQSALLAAPFLSSINVVTSATAIVQMFDNPCILALGASNAGIEIADLTHLDMPNCSAVANSSSQNAIELHGSTSSITAATLVTAGEVSLQQNPIDPTAPPSQFVLAMPAMIGAPSVADPYASTLTHAFLTARLPTGGCRSSAKGGVRTYSGNCVLTPGTGFTRSTNIKLAASTQIAGGLTISTGQTINLSPGTYWVTGDLTVQSNGVLECLDCKNTPGAGVTIILTTKTNKIGAVSIASSAVINLNSPSSGLFAGLVVVQDSNGLPMGTTFSSSHSTISGGLTGSINGLVYFPKSSVTFHGASGATGPKCLLLVVSTLNIDAASSLDIGGCASAGLTNLPIIRTVALVE